MKYYSHVICIPQTKPFDNQHRWGTFLGLFVKPLVEGHDFLYWFSYYTTFARFRIYTDKYELIEPKIVGLMSALGLSYKLDNGERMELDLTLEDDLGNPRFLGSERTDVTPTERGFAILKLLHAGAQLFLTTLVRDGDYWREEICLEPNNPFDSSSRSYIHLLHNLAQSDVQIVQYQTPQGSIQVTSEYHFSYIRPIPHQHKLHRVVV